MFYITDMEKLNLPDWLNRKFLEWQMKNGRATEREFAEYLGIKPAIFSHYMNGRRIPRGENLYKIADKLGYEAYDILGYLRPDKAIREMNEIYSELPDDLKEEFMDVIREYKKLHGKRG